MGGKRVTDLVRSQIERKIGKGATESGIEVVATGVGEARLHASATLGDLRDESIHRRRVLPDTITTPVTETLRFSGDRTFHPKHEQDSRQLTILGSRAAVLAQS